MMEAKRERHNGSRKLALKWQCNDDKVCEKASEKKDQKESFDFSKPKAKFIMKCKLQVKQSVQTILQVGSRRSTDFPFSNLTVSSK